MASGKWFGKLLMMSTSVGTLAVLASAAFALPEDIVPRGDVAYDLLASLSGAGRVKGRTVGDFFRGDRLYTRREMAEIVADLLATNDVPGLPGSTRAHVRALLIEFAPELRARGVVIPALPAGDAGFSALLKARGGASPASGRLVGRFALSSAIGRDGYLAASVGNYRDEWNALQPLKGNYPAVETLFLRYNTRVLDFTVGQQPLRWGPGFSGALLLGGESPSIPQIRVEKGFVLPGSLGRRAGRFYFTQFAGEVYEDDVASADPVVRGTLRYVFGRRLETAGDRGPWRISFAETFKSTRLPGAGWAFVLPFYAYQNAFTKFEGRADHRLLGFIADGHTYPNSLWLNYLADIQVSYKAIPARDTSVYADLLIDDLKAPRGASANDGPVPRKIGFQVGGYAPRLDNRGRFGLRLEYTLLDATTYLTETIPKNYAVNGVSLGYPYGGNGHVFFGRLDARVSEKAKASAEVSLRSRSKASDLGFVGNRYSVYGVYNLTRSAFVGARVDHVTGDTRLANVSTHDATRGELSVGYGF